jgi:hypothetical protein
MMNMRVLGAAVAGLALGTSALAAPAPPPVKEGSGASDHVKCDGKPNNVTAGETAARLLGAVTLLGLFAPAPETADSSKRLFGVDGIAACDRLLVSGEAGEGNSQRRIQLHLARAIHRIEAKDYAAAIEDLRGLEREYADRTSTIEYKLGTGLSVKYIEALALAGMGNHLAAADKALEISEAAPYDLAAGLRVASLIDAGGRYDAREKAYYDRMVKLMPVALSSRAAARQIARDYRGAAQDYDLLATVLDSYLGKDEPSGISAQASLMWYLAGDKAAGAEREAEARAFVDKQTAAGKSPTGTIELLDFAHIVKLIGEGDLRQARLLFAGRTKWTSPTSSALAEVSARLRKEAKPDDLIGLLAKAPEDFVKEQRDTRLGLINAAGEKGEKRFVAVAPAVSRAGFDRFSTQIWKTGKSRYVAKKENAKSKAWPVNMYRDGTGVESGYALLLASALEAKKRDLSHFTLYPVRLSLAGSEVRMGAADGNLIHEEISFKTDQVIADLSPLFPEPQKK